MTMIIKYLKCLFFCVKNVCFVSAAETRDHADMIDRKNSEKSKNFTIT